MLKIFPMQNDVFFLLIVMCFVNIVSPMGFANSASGAEGKGVDEINLNLDINYVDTQPVPNSLLSSQLNSNPEIYLVQTQSESSTRAESDLQQSNSSSASEGSTSDRVTNNSTSANGVSPSTESTEGNLSPKSTMIECEGSALCITGEVVKVINGKTFYVNIQGKIYKVELALIGLPLQSEEAMREATTFTRNTCLGSNVLIDQDDGQKVDSFIAQVYCSPTKNLNSLLLQTGYVQLDESQCQISEFSKLDWAKSRGC
jgi:endonuclease YncB( thermonuclease family)